MTTGAVNLPDDQSSAETAAVADPTDTGDVNEDGS